MAVAEISTALDQVEAFFAGVRYLRAGTKIAEPLDFDTNIRMLRLRRAKHKSTHYLPPEVAIEVKRGSKDKSLVQ